MNQPPRSPLPPFGDDTDEALNALIDGELAAFAADRGITEPEARARLDGWPGADSRLAELESVRASVQAQPTPLDDVARRRLVRNAADELPDRKPASRRSRSWVAITAVAAAGLLAVAGIGVAISSMDGDGGQRQDSATGSASSALARLHGDVGNLGDVSSPEALRALLDRRESEAAVGSTTTLAPTAAGAEDSTTFDRNQRSSSSPVPPLAQQSKDADPVDLDSCAEQLAGTRPVAFTGTGTYRGEPVAIVGVSKGGRTIVFVVARSDCTNVLASISR